MSNTQIKNMMTASCEWISPDASLQDAAKMMKEQDIGFLPVGENDKLIGSLTDRDIAIRAIAAGKNPSTTTVRECMSKKVYYCYDDQNADDICKNMAEVQVMRFPVVNRSKRLVGVVSYADLSAGANPKVYTVAQQQLKSIPDSKIAA